MATAATQPVAAGVGARVEGPILGDVKRRLAIFRRARAFDPSPTPGMTVEQAVTREDLEQAYRLVYESYLDAGYIHPNRTGLRVRVFSALPHCALFVAKVGGRVVGTASMIADSPLGLPMEKAFGKEVRALRVQGRRMIEGSDLAVAKDYRNLRVLTELTRCVIAHALYVGADDMLLAISPEHSGYFQGLVQFESLGDSRTYSNEKLDIVEGKRLSLFCLEEKYLSVDSALGEQAFLHQFFIASNPYPELLPAWQEQAAAAMRDPGLFAEFFVEKAGLLEQCTQDELRALAQYHPEVDVLGLARQRVAKLAAVRTIPLVQAFRRAAERVPAYRELLREAHVAASQIETVEAFRRLAPILDRSNTFDRFPVRDLCVDGSVGRLHSIRVCGAHPRSSCVGLSSIETREQEAERSDAALDHFFHTQSRRTLLLHGRADGGCPPSRAVTVADLGPRPDQAIALVQSLGSEFEQIVLAGESAFVKQVLEDGSAAGLAWPRLRVHVALSDQVLAENCRTYLAQLLGLDPEADEGGHILATPGMPETGPYLFYESMASIRVRRCAHRNTPLRQRLFPSAAAWCPMLYHYDPTATFVETPAGQDPPADLLVSTLSLDIRLPLLRYRTGLRAELLSAKRVEAIVASSGHPVIFRAADPCVALYGSAGADPGSAPLCPQAVQEGLYYDPRLAARTTGRFRLLGGENPTVVVQARPGAAPDDALAQALADAIRLYAGQPAAVRCLPCDDFTR